MKYEHGSSRIFQLCFTNITVPPGLNFIKIRDESYVYKGLQNLKSPSNLHFLAKNPLLSGGNIPDRIAENAKASGIFPTPLM